MSTTLADLGKEITVKLKNVYGVEHVYCTSEHAKHIYALTNRKTLSISDMDALIAMGYEFIYDLRAAADERLSKLIPRTKVKGKFKDTYEICTAIDKEIKNPLIMFSPDAATTKWDNIEIQPVKEYTGKESGNWCEPCEEGEEDFWSVYLHQVEGGVQCIADLPTYELAGALSDLLKEAVKTYQLPAEPRVKSLYMVDIYYRTVAGNCASYRQVLEAFSSEEAMNTVTAKVEKKKRWFKTDGGDCIRL